MNNINREKLTPMMKQYFDIKDKYQEYILFYRLGDFYEMFFDDAVVASQILEIALTGRNCGLKDKAPLCGVPYHSVNGYIEKMIKAGYKVAICEQTEDPALAKGLVKRDVTRVVTPGTVIDPDMLEEGSGSYIFSIYCHGKGIYTAAYGDITTGELRAFESFDRNGIIDEVNKFTPREILVQDDLTAIDEKLFLELAGYSVTNLSSNSYKKNRCEDIIKKTMNVFSLEALGLEKDSPLIYSVGSLLDYVYETQKVSLNHINSLKVYSLKDYMVLDKFTRRNLEITESIRGQSKKGSLLSVIDYTSTSMGARRLKSILSEPLINREDIDKRLDGVEELYEDVFLRDELRTALRNIYDIERLASKLVYGNINPRDFVALKSSIERIPAIKECLSYGKSSVLREQAKNIDELKDIFKWIDDAIVDHPPISLKDGGVIRKSFNSELSVVNDAISNGNSWLNTLEDEEREKTGIKNLKINFNKVFGFFIEVTNSNTSLAPDRYIRKQTLSNCERFITEELKEIEDKILGAQDKRIILEASIYSELKEQCLKEVNRLMETARMIAYLDVLVSLSEAAEKRGFARPLLNDQGIIEIKDGRHPVVENLLPESTFIPNDTVLDSEENLIYIITGPNMAGKSTYLRQVAIITLMAQIGSFVPASYANIGVVDRIFTRVGASDDIASGQSTFMVEMNELANILKNATSKSLVILDEIGRGTSTYDGLSIAWATIEYISGFSGSRYKTMFATHYHELTELEGKFPGVKNYRIDVDEISGEVVFLRKIVRGSSGKSYGIQVAKLAGVPKEVVDIANSILIRLEANDINNNIESILRGGGADTSVSEESADDLQSRFEGAGNKNQISFFSQDDKYSALISMIDEIDINNTTPVKALTILEEIIRKAGRIK